MRTYWCVMIWKAPETRRGYSTPEEAVVAAEDLARAHPTSRVTIFQAVARTYSDVPPEALPPVHWEKIPEAWEALT